MKNKIPLEYMIVEVMFGEIFRLPNPEFIEICYGSILIELCKLQPSTMPQVIFFREKIVLEAPILLTWGRSFCRYLPRPLNSSTRGWTR